jgi:hypothetical protein
MVSRGWRAQVEGAHCGPSGTCARVQRNADLTSRARSRLASRSAAWSASAANPKFASYCGTGVCELRVQSGTRIIDFASVPLIPRFASSVPQAWANLGIGTLATCAQFDSRQLWCGRRLRGNRKSLWKSLSNIGARCRRTGAGITAASCRRARTALNPHMLGQFAMGRWGNPTARKSG